jgi:PHS family inorganic phosphate transporter-like MFS transporter
MDHVLEIYALFMLLGCFSTLLIKETTRKTLEELAEEDDYAATAPPLPAAAPAPAEEAPAEKAAESG